MDADRDKGDSTQALTKENQELREKLRQYRELEEDLAAQRVFDKAKKQLTTWITFGGLLLFLAGLVGIKAVVDYTKGLVSKKLEELGQTGVEKYLREEGHRQITAKIQEQQDELMIYAKQQIQLLTAPIRVQEAGPTPHVLERKLDYTDLMLPVRNQGSEGSAVGFAVAAGIEYQIRKTLQKVVRISPRYIYYFARVQGKGDPHQDTGATIEDALRVVSDRGAVAENAWPYKPGEFGSDPPELKGAEFYKIKKYRSLRTLDEIKAALRSYGPVLAGITVYQAFLGPEVRKTGIVPMPSKSESIVGGDALCVVGYDDDQQMLKFLNQWGPEWGDHGYGYVSYAYMSKFSQDVWAISM
jgi:C1A family cysteine protease